MSLATGRMRRPFDPRTMDALGSAYRLHREPLERAVNAPPSPPSREDAEALRSALLEVGAEVMTGPAAATSCAAGDSAGASYSAAAGPQGSEVG